LSSIGDGRRACLAITHTRFAILPC
jgi:hypothetical protein